MVGDSVIGHLFLPQHTNNHRPKTLQIDALFVYFVLLLVMNFGLNIIGRSRPDVLGYATDIQVTQLLEYTNTAREKDGLSPLMLNTQLSEAAARKATDMFTKNYWAHNSPTGNTPWDFIVASGYTYQIAGENLAKNFDTSRTVVDAWMASPSHRDNVLKPAYRDVGYAVINGTLNGEETTLVVQMFGATSTRSIVQAAERSPTIAPTPVPRTTPSAVRNETPVIISEAASQTDTALTYPFSGVARAFSRVTNQPLLNVSLFWRELALVFLGMLMGVLFVDAWLVARRRTVRLAGHNIAHIFFLGSFIFLIQWAQRGSLL